MKQELKDKRKTLKNLKKAYDGLLELAKVDRNIIEDFDMGTFGVFNELEEEQVKSNKCDTRGCLLGNMARIFKPKKEYFIENDYGAYWFDYWEFGKIEFPSVFSEQKYFNDLGVFLFDGDWDQCQPTFEQAMERLKYAIDMDLEIGQWIYRRDSFIKE